MSVQAAAGCYAASVSLLLFLVSIVNHRHVRGLERRVRALEAAIETLEALRRWNKL